MTCVWRGGNRFTINPDNLQIRRVFHLPFCALFFIGEGVKKMFNIHKCSRIVYLGRSSLLWPEASNPMYHKLVQVLFALEHKKWSYVKIRY